MDPSAAAPMIMDPATQAIVGALKGAYEQGGWLAVAGLALMFGVRIVRMSEGGAAWWDALTKARKRLYAFGSGAAGATIVAVSTGAPIGSAVPGAIVAGLLATIFHHGTERVAAAAGVKLTGNAKADAVLRAMFGHDLDGAESPEPPAGEPGKLPANVPFPPSSNEPPPGGAA